MSVHRGIVLKNSKIAASENLANDACWRFQPLRCSVESIRAPAAGFAVLDMDPHIAVGETAPAVLRIFNHREKGLFQHNPGQTGSHWRMVNMTRLAHIDCPLSRI